MEKSADNPFAAVVTALHQSGCRYVIVGGFAVVMHGSSRFTPDINIALDLEAKNLQDGLLALSGAGLTCASSKECLDFLQPEVRRRLYDPATQGKRFFSLRSDQFPMFSVELFYEAPLPFNELFSTAVMLKFSEGALRICSVAQLIKMKEMARRTQDLMDLDNLKTLQILERLKVNEPIDWTVLHEAEPPVDDDRVMDLVSFRTLPAGEKLEWLYRMLQVLGG